MRKIVRASKETGFWPLALFSKLLLLSLVALVAPVTACTVSEKTPSSSENKTLVTVDTNYIDMIFFDTARLDSQVKFCAYRITGPRIYETPPKTKQLPEEPKTLWEYIVKLLERREDGRRAQFEEIETTPKIINQVAFHPIQSPKDDRHRPMSWKEFDASVKRYAQSEKISSKEQFFIDFFFQQLSQPGKFVNRVVVGRKNPLKVCKEQKAETCEFLKAYPEKVADLTVSFNYMKEQFANTETTEKRLSMGLGAPPEILDLTEMLIREAGPRKIDHKACADEARLLDRIRAPEGGDDK